MGSREEGLFEPSPLLNMFTCTICCEVPHPSTAKELPGCGHIFCDGCLRKTRQSGTICPNCRAHSQFHPPRSVYNESKLIYRHMNNLLVKCDPTIYSQECSWKGSWSDLDGHLQKCPVLMLDCAYKKNGCDKRCFRKDMMQHEYDCLYRKWPCSACHQEFLLLDCVRHESVCPERRVLCNICQSMVQRKYMTSHMKDNATQHIEYLRTQLDRKDQRIDELRVEVSQLTEEVSRGTESVSRLKGEVSDLTEDVSTLRSEAVDSSDEVASLRSQVSDLNKTVAVLNCKLNDLKLAAGHTGSEVHTLLIPHLSSQPWTSKPLAYQGYTWVLCAAMCSFKGEDYHRVTIEMGERNSNKIPKGYKIDLGCSIDVVNQLDKSIYEGGLIRDDNNKYYFGYMICPKNLEPYLLEKTLRVDVKFSSLALRKLDM